MQIVVVDLGVGNLRSVEHAVRTVAGDADVQVSSQPEAVNNADKIVLPGQGAVGTWFKNLRERNLEQSIRTALREKPMLGICVGMQALFDYCDEDGGMKGLGLFNGSVRHFDNFHAKRGGGERLKIPQMGWNQVGQTQSHPLWQGIEDQSHFYFVHSYCANTNPDANLGFVVGHADYGHQFIAAAAAPNVFAVQFHPEKSHDNGLKLIKNFTTWDGGQ